MTFALLLNPAHPAVAAVRGTFARHWTKPKSGAGGDGLGGGGAKGYGEIMGPPAPLKLSQLDSPMVKLVRTAMCETLSDEDAKGAMQVFLAPNLAALEHQLSLALGDVQFQTGKDGYRTFTLKARKTVSQEYKKYFTNSIVLVVQPRNGGHVRIGLCPAWDCYQYLHSWAQLEALPQHRGVRIIQSCKALCVRQDRWDLAHRMVPGYR